MKKILWIIIASVLSVGIVWLIWQDQRVETAENSRIDYQYAILTQGSNDNVPESKIITYDQNKNKLRERKFDAWIEPAGNYNAEQGVLNNSWMLYEDHGVGRDIDSIYYNALNNKIKVEKSKYAQGQKENVFPLGNYFYEVNDGSLDLTLRKLDQKFKVINQITIKRLELGVGMFMDPVGDVYLMGLKLLKSGQSQTVILKLDGKTLKQKDEIKLETTDIRMYMNMAYMNNKIYLSKYAEGKTATGENAPGYEILEYDLVTHQKRWIPISNGKPMTLIANEETNSVWINHWPDDSQGEEPVVATLLEVTTGEEWHYQFRYAEIAELYTPRVVNHQNNQLKLMTKRAVYQVDFEQKRMTEIYKAKDFGVDNFQLFVEK